MNWKHVFISAILISTEVTYCQSNYDYQVEKVQEGIYLFKPIISDYRWVTSNIALIINGDDALVVDSGLLPEAAQSAIKEIKKITTKPVKYLVNTHWHGDHWQGNGAFVKEYPNIQIIATEQSGYAMKENGMVWAGNLYLKYFNKYVQDYEKAIQEKSLDGKILSNDELVELKKAINELKADIEGIKKLNPQLPNTYFSDKLVLVCGAREIQVLYLGVGNTSGDAIVYLPQEKIVVAGDLVVAPSPYESGMFSPEWLETSQKLAGLDFNTLIPGHGDAQQGKAYLRFLNSFFEEIIRQVKFAYLRLGISSVDDLKKAVTHKSVSDELLKHPEYKAFVELLDPEFVPAAIQTSFKRIIQGKK